jgi:cell fate (sporulation/competence/biofilm development) regulator YlbF (YheA/YmcA/DUF963 family)
MCRILAFAFLVFAFAQPFIPSGEKVNTDQKVVSIFIDNSFSMESRGENVALLDEAKQKAVEIVDAFSESDRFQILTADFEGRHQRLVGKEDARTLVDEIAISPKTRTLPQIIDRQTNVMSNYTAEQRWRYVISDFQQNIAGDIQLDTLDKLHLIPLRAVAENNLTVDSVWFVEPLLLPNQRALLLVKITNYGIEDREDIRISLNYGGEQRPVGSRDIPSGASIIDSVSFFPDRPGWQEAEISLEDYPVYFDDTYYFSFEIQKSIDVLSIGDESDARYLEAAYSGSPIANFTFQTPGNILYTDFPAYNLIIIQSLENISSGLQSQLLDYVLGGGNLLIFPPFNADLESYNQFFAKLGTVLLGDWTISEQAGGSINTQEFIFRDVFEGTSRNMTLPRVKGYYKMGAGATGLGETLLNLRSGDPLISKWNRGEGRTYLVYSPLNPEYSDLLSRGEILIPLLYRTALASSNDKLLAYNIGSGNLVPVPFTGQGEDPVFRMEGPSAFIPAIAQRGNQLLIDPGDLVEEAGHYRILNRDSLIRWCSFNYSRNESRMAFLNTETLRERYPQAEIFGTNRSNELTASIQTEAQGKRLWYYCIIFVLVFLLLEQLLLRFYK